MAEAASVVAPPLVYDSANTGAPVLGELREFWRRRGLLGLLVLVVLMVV